ncbi:MAG: MATE family efflux transporter, partial [Clostridia bacterium]|nr:MATE family efflux transporter [Clostridia bacterium]
FGSAFFTSLSNGGISLLISFSRTFLCQIIAVLVLPIFLGVLGVWLSLFVAESITLVLTAALYILEKKRYGY